MRLAAYFYVLARRHADRGRCQPEEVVMTMRTDGYDDDQVEQRSSGIPPPWRLGASRNEMLGLIVALVAFALIAIGFVYESMP
jgi:hypothetical protein